MGSSSRSRPTPVPRASIGIPSSWNWFSHGPLRGMILERESLSIVAWDDARHLYRLNVHGQLQSEIRRDEDIRLIASSDTGEHTFVVTSGPSLSVLTREGPERSRISLPFEPIALASDPFGDYAVLASKDARLIMLDRQGKTVYKTSTPQNYQHLAFVPASGQVIAAAEQGVVASHDLRGNLLWKETMYSTIGGMGVDHAGTTIALAAHTYGIVRFSANGKREGAYQLPRPPHLVAIDFDGSRLVGGSVDGYLFAVDHAGHLLAEKPLAEKASCVCIDPLGRFAILGFASGEIRFFDWANIISAEPTTTDNKDRSTLSSSTARDPHEAWSNLISADEEEARSTILEPLFESQQLAISTNRRTIRIVDADGRDLHESARLEGTGRLLVAGPGGLFAATDRRLLFYDARTRISALFGGDFFDISHLLPLQTPGEAIIIESCDTIHRIRTPDSFLWKERLPGRASSVAVDHESNVAVILEDQQMIILDSVGKKRGRFQAPRSAPLLVASIPGGWVTASIDEQELRYHDSDGRVKATATLPWDPWGIYRLGSQIVVTRANGQSLLVQPSDGSVLENTEPREGASYFSLPSSGGSIVARAFLSGPTMTVTDFAGKLVWRQRPIDVIHRFAVRERALWILAGRHLAMYRLPMVDRR
jgi:hypothetical protein